MTVFSRKENHRVYLQRYLPPPSPSLSPFSSSSSNNKGTDQGHRLVTSSAAIRLTDAATADNVTSLLRKKFGLVSNPASSDENQSSAQASLSILKKEQTEKEKYRYFYGDALILVGTLHNLPRQHLEYDHEKHLFPNFNIRNTSPQNHSNVDRGSSSVSSSTVISNPSIDNSNESNIFAMTNQEMHMHNQISQMQTEEKTENINVIRTLLPYENPLVVRDEMLAHLYQRQHEFDQQMLSRQPNTSSTPEGENQSHERLKKVEQILQRQRNKKDDPKNKKRNAVNRSIRWFYQPNGGAHYNFLQPNQSQSLSPSLLNLDGYISAAEESDSEDEDEDEDEDDSCHETKSLDHPSNLDDESRQKSSNYPMIDREQWNSDYLYYHQLFQSEPYDHLQSDNYTNILQELTSRTHEKKIRKRHDLAQLQNQLSNNYTVSGYLLKRSAHDPNVWRKMYCTLTDEQFWYVTRIKRLSSDSASKHNHQQHSQCNNDNDKHSFTRSRSANHHVIHLSRASICQPNTIETEPKSRLSSMGPIHLIQIYSDEDGKIHTFCAPHLKAQLYWIKAISSKINSCMENKLMEFAELIVEEEEDARTTRMEENSLLHCWQRINTNPSNENDDTVVLGQKWYNKYRITEDIWWWKELVRLCMLIQEYREVCRHFLSYGCFFEGETTPVQKKQVERWKFITCVQWKAAETVCMSKSFLCISFSGKPKNGNVFYRDDGGQLGEIGANTRAFVSESLRKANTNHLNDVVMVQAPPIDLFDSIMKKILTFKNVVC